MNRPENLIGLAVENTSRMDKFLLAVFGWGAIIYTASSRFSLNKHGPEIEEKIKECIDSEGWEDCETLGTCEAGALLFKYARKNSQTRLFFYDLLRDRCGYAEELVIGPAAIYYRIRHV